MGNYDRAIKVINGVLKYRNRVNNLSTLGRLYYILGVINTRMGKMDEAKKYLEKVIKIGDKISDYEILGYGHSGLGIYHRSQDNCEEAIHQFEEARKYFEIIKNMKGASKALSNIGLVYYENDNSAAEEYFKEALNIARRIGDLWQIGLVKMYLGNFYLRFDSPDLALRYLSDSKKILESLDSKDVLPYVYAGYGAALIEIGRVEDGMEYLRRAREISNEKVKMKVEKFIEEMMERADIKDGVSI